MLNKIAIKLVLLYRVCISPYFPPCCRYMPTCSDYSIQAFQKYGVLKGGLLSIVRLLKCNPLFKGGHDPLK
ncbi:MAG: membrane protein insertion efficiency factor YidD [Desulfuromonadaceae bacterium]|nr:membrane protein insertion efficiency factor YidD [Desulfuromonadaceae bacterium]